MAVAVSLGVLFLSVLYFLVPAISFWRSNLLYSMAFACVLLVGVRALLGRLIGGETFKRRIVVMGAGSRAARIGELAKQPGVNFVAAGFIAMNEAAPVVAGAVARADIPNLAAYVIDLGASEVVMALEERRNALPLADLLRVKTTGVQVYELSTFLERETGRIDLNSVNPSWLIFSDGFAGGRLISGTVKRAFDIVASLALLILTLPLVLIAAAAVKLESAGPAFYRQRRVGLYNQRFRRVEAALDAHRCGGRRPGAMGDAQNDVRE